jgi:hypothetical protein
MKRRALKRRYGHAAVRVRQSDKSMAGNLIYGHADGRGGLREWDPRDLERIYNLPWRWGSAILKFRREARQLGRPGVRGDLGTTGAEAVKWYAKKIAEIRDSVHPENF